MGKAILAASTPVWPWGQAALGLGAEGGSISGTDLGGRLASEMTSIPVLASLPAPHMEPFPASPQGPQTPSLALFLHQPSLFSVHYLTAPSPLTKVTGFGSQPYGLVVKFKHIPF